MRIGLYGYPGSGSTTLFAALTGRGGEAPTGTVAAVKVPDQRVERLAAMYRPRKVVHAEIVFTDIQPEAGGRTMLPSLSDARAMDLLCLVIRAFPAPWLEEPTDAARDLQRLLESMTLLDLELIEGYLERNKKVKEKDSYKEELARRMEAHLSAGRPLRTLGLDAASLARFRGMSFLTLKPMLAVINRGEEAAAAPVAPELEALLRPAGLAGLSLCATIEREIAGLPPADQAPFLADLGLASPLTGRFVRAVYDLADFVSFFTVGDDEVRAWPITRGTSASDAAGTIHSDLQRGFIRAEVFTYDELIAAGDEQALKQAGKLRLEGKDYEVRDGDVINVRFNV